MKQVLVVLLLLAIVAFVVNALFFEQKSGSSGSNVTSTDKPLLSEKSPLPEEFGIKFADDVRSVHSNLSDDDVHTYNDLPEVKYTLGTPNKTLSYPDSTCASQPFILAVYDDLGLPEDGLNRKSYVLVYRNLHCQPDGRAYVLLGIHPVPGVWWNLLKR